MDNVDNKVLDISSLSDSQLDELLLSEIELNEKKSLDLEASKKLYEEYNDIDLSKKEK